MIGSILAVVALSLPLVSCKGGKGGGGGGGGGGSGGGGSGGTDFISYAPQECYATFLNPPELASNGSDGRNAGPDLGLSGSPVYRFIFDDYNRRNTCMSDLNH